MKNKLALMSFFCVHPAYHWDNIAKKTLCHTMLNLNLSYVF